MFEFVLDFTNVLEFIVVDINELTLSKMLKRIAIFIKLCPFSIENTVIDLKAIKLIRPYDNIARLKGYLGINQTEHTKSKIVLLEEDSPTPRPRNVSIFYVNSNENY